MRTTDDRIARAYTATGQRWSTGPDDVYGRLAEVVLGHAPVPVEGAVVLDIGAGTGAASRAAASAGARRVVAVDVAPGMLHVDAAGRPPGVVAEATRLPLPDHCVDGAVASFSFNHLADPSLGFREATRVVRPGGWVVASAYAATDTHPVKSAVVSALEAHGWAPDAWYQEVSQVRAPLLADEAGCRRAAEEAGLDARVTEVHVEFPELDAAGLVAWRLGMAQHAPFLATLDPAEQQEIADRALVALGPDPEPLVRSIMVVAARL